MDGSKVALSFLSAVIVMTLTVQAQREYITTLIKSNVSRLTHVSASLIPPAAETYVSRGITDINI